MKMKRTIEKELEPLLLSLGYRRVVGGQGSYCYRNDEAGICITYHVARVAHRFEKEIEVDFNVRDLERVWFRLTDFPGESPLSYETQEELDSRLRHALDATVNTVLPYIQNMIKYAVQEPRTEDYQALADHPEQRAARFSSQYHIPLIPEQSTLLQLDSVLRSIRPENLHELRDVFHANYETMIDMAAFYGMLFVKRARHYSMGWAPLTPPDDPYYHLLTMPEIERFVVLETGESDPRPGVRSDVLSFVIQAWNHMGLKWSTFSSLALL